MNTRTVRCLLLVALATVALSGRARPSTRTAMLEAFAGTFIPTQDVLQDGFATGFGFTWPLAGRTRVGVHFIHSGLQSLGREHDLLPGRLTLTPFLVFIRQEASLALRLTLHVSAGGGIVFARLREEIITIPEVTISQLLSNSPALYLAAGFRLIILKNLAIIGQGSYLHCRAEGTITVRDMNFGVSGEEVRPDLSAVQALAGLALIF